MRKKIPSHVKKYVAWGQKWTCNICKNMLPANFEIDHIVALCNGGTDDVNNLQALCPNCHSTKTIHDLHTEYHFSSDVENNNQTKFNELPLSMYRVWDETLKQVVVKSIYFKD